jgi:hypothetical protein
MCEIGHKLDNTNTDAFSIEKQIEFWKKKNLVARHNLQYTKIKEQFARQIDQLSPGLAILMMDFKENITIGSGPRELGQSWYSRERRTVFGLTLLQKRRRWGSYQKTLQYHFQMSYP